MGGRGKGGRRGEDVRARASRLIAPFRAQVDLTNAKSVAMVMADAKSEAIAEEAMAQAEDLVGCAMDAGDDACRDSFIASFGSRVFRRPLSETERDRYALLHSVTESDSDFAGGIEVVLTAMLQSPHFLYRRELGVAQEDGTYELTPHEVASFLSYFLWGSMPDEELFTESELRLLRDLQNDVFLLTT